MSAVVDQVEATPSREAGRTRLPPPRRLRTGLEAWLHAAEGRWRRRDAVRQRWQAAAAAVLARREDWRTWSDERLDEEMGELRARERRAAGRREGARVEALAGWVEIAARTLGLEAHPAQVVAAWGLTEGALVELPTGEGKTLALALAAGVAAWAGRPCHVVTANDYLAVRDARGLAGFYARGGVSVGVVGAGLAPAERAGAYGAEVVYTTAKELLADFLRDRLLLGRWQHAGRRAVRRLDRDRAEGAEPAGLVLRGVHTVLLDEADHTLVDEAATPLIISRRRADPLLAEACAEVSEWVGALRRDRDYTVDPEGQRIELTAAAVQAVRESWQPRARVLRNRRWRAELVRLALQAREFFRRDRHYVVRDGQVVLIDEGTGRLQEQRSWRRGLHQLVEAKEGLALTAATETAASVSFQQFFRRVPRLAGVTGTAAENAAELWRGYGLPVVAVPPHRPSRRTSAPLRVRATADARWAGVVDAIAACQTSGQPVLVGTRSVAASEHLAALLAARAIPCAVLNARQLDREAEIVARAGQRGRVTIATNLAGRGTDIRLGPGVVELGGLVVIATELHAAARVDRQLHGRAGRQGDPGRVEPWASWEDELAVRFVPAGLRRILAAAVTREWTGAQPLSRAALRWAQMRAEQMAARQRRDVVRRDEWLQDFLGT